jgi:iron(II)-dependent oxidoreductase
MALRLFSRNRRQGQANVPRAVPSTPTLPGPEYRPAEQGTYSPEPLERAQQMGRFGVILARHEPWAHQPGYDAAHAAAAQAIDDRFGLVPEGYASIPLTVSDEPGCPEEDHETEPYLLARHAVTNAEFQMFVDDGGYQELELWPQDIWPHLISFKDLTDEPGPRFWQQGRHDRRLADHPVVGVCYYEAAAYARWAGYRLPTEAEWQMAATWRIRSNAHVRRRYPWGNALDLKHCNIWHCGHGHTLPVDACPSGAAPNGVVQLIGNVWEWTESDVVLHGEQGQMIVGDMLMKSIRGGAYDTYFAWQATGSFRTGLACLARSHNVGFRCALDLPTE